MSKSRWFEPHQRRCVESLSKALYPHFLILVQPRRTSRHDRKIVDLGIKHQLKQAKLILKFSITELLYFQSVYTIMSESSKESQSQNSEFGRL